MKTVRCTTAQAIVRYLIAQQIDIEGEVRPLFPGVFAIFGHGNVTCLGPALEEAGEALPTWRGQNEQGMALAAVAYAKAMRRRQIMVATSSIGPGATNMVTAAAVAHANRLPAAAAGRRHVRQPHPGPGAAAGRALRRPVGHGQRRLQAGDPLLGPDRAARAGRPHPAPRRRHDARPGDVRAGLPRPAPGRAGRGLRLPGPAVRAHRARDRQAAPRHPPARTGGGRAGRRRASVDHRRRRRALLVRRGGAGRLRRAPRRSRWSRPSPARPAWWRPTR